MEAKNYDRNVALYPWFKLCTHLTFAQAVWFLYFQEVLSPSDAILLYVVGDVATTLLEVPSGYASDRFGRRPTLILASVYGASGAILLASGDDFVVFAIGQTLLGASFAFASGTDSAVLYESLTATGRGQEIEAQELKAWRFGFGAAAISALVGGAIALISPALTFVLMALALTGSSAIATAFREPPRAVDLKAATNGREGGFAALRRPLANPVLLWFLALSVLMYVFSHLPFVFGQPFIQHTLEGVGLDDDAPLVSGAISTGMMALSVIASFFVRPLRNRMGLAAVLGLALGMQITLIGMLSLADDLLVMSVLVLRMVPDAIAIPLITARVQPELADDTRATHLSLQSLCGRLLFAAILLIASGSIGRTDELSYSAIQRVLGSAGLVGLLCLAALAIFAARLPIERCGTRAAGGNGKCKVFRSLE